MHERWRTAPSLVKKRLSSFQQTPGNHTLLLQRKIDSTVKKLNTLLFLSASAMAPLKAAVVYADFNDNSAANPLGSFTAGAGQGGGSGFLAGDVWANTGTINVVANDLTAPASTGYGLTQSGTPQSAQGTFATGRQTTRATATTLGTSSSVWFSFLLNQPTTNSRGGITFNQNSSSPGNLRVVATGVDVRLGLGATLQPAGGGATMAIGSDTLIVGQLLIDPAGDETLSIWVNPDVSSGIPGLGAANTSLSEQAAAMDGGITRVGIQSYSSDNLGGIVDSLVISDAADENQAFADITGTTIIPEPSSALLTLLASLGLIRRRR